MKKFYLNVSMLLFATLLSSSSACWAGVDVDEPSGPAPAALSGLLTEDFFRSASLVTTSLRTERLYDRVLVPLDERSDVIRFQVFQVTHYVYYQRGDHSGHYVLTADGHYFAVGYHLFWESVQLSPGKWDNQWMWKKQIFVGVKPEESFFAALSDPARNVDPLTHEKANLSRILFLDEGRENRPALHALRRMDGGVGRFSLCKNISR